MDERKLVFTGQTECICGKRKQRNEQRFDSRDSTQEIRLMKETKMKFKLLVIAGALLIALGFSLTATAGTILDSDLSGTLPAPDLIPDVFDNCKFTPNGPPQGASAQGLSNNQRDTDADDHGDACDCDYDQDGFVLGGDITELFTNFNTTSVLHDNTGDGFVLGGDITVCFARFNSAVGD